MCGSEWGQLPNASSGMRYILIRASRYKMYRPLRNALGSCPHSGPTSTYSMHSSQTCSGADINLVARHCRALKYGGRSQSSGLTQFLIRLSERSRNRTPLPSYCRAHPGVTFQNIPQDARNPRRTKCAAGVSCMSEDVLKSNTRAGPDENNRLQVDMRFLDRERLGEVAGAAVARCNFLKLRKLLGADALRDRAARVETAAGRRIQR